MEHYLPSMNYILITYEFIGYSPNIIYFLFVTSFDDVPTLLLPFPYTLCFFKLQALIWSINHQDIYTHSLYMNTILRSAKRG